MKKSSPSSIAVPRWVLAGLACLLIVTATATLFSILQTPRVGYIDSSVLLEHYTGAVEARAQLEARLETWQTNIQTLEAELAQMNQDIMEHHESWNQAMRQEKRAAFEEKQREYGRYSRAVGEKAAQLEQELMTPVLAELNARIQDFGEDTNRDLIFGTTAAGNILFAEADSDLTEDFLAYVGQEVKAAAMTETLATPLRDVPTTESL